MTGPMTNIPTPAWADLKWCALRRRILYPREAPQAQSRPVDYDMLLADARTGRRTRQDCLPRMWALLTENRRQQPTRVRG